MTNSLKADATCSPERQDGERPTTRLRYARKQLVNRRRRLKPHEDDGPLVTSIKWTCSRPGFYKADECFVDLFMKYSSEPDALCRESKAKAAFNAAIELYWLLWTAISAFCFALVWWGRLTAADRAALAMQLALSAFGLFAFTYRLLDIIATDLRLTILGHFHTDTFAHALLQFFFEIWQVILCFAGLYTIVAFCSSDIFARAPADGLWASFVNPIYFSTVTLTTVGYGDLSPNMSPGRCLVMAEVFIGIGLLIVVVQRTLGGAFQPERDRATKACNQTEGPATRQSEPIDPRL